nr:8349_t:CDS:10 [Entrophospora candida]
MVKVGEVIFSLIFKLLAINWVKVVLPTPNSPWSSKKVLGCNLVLPIYIPKDITGKGNNRLGNNMPLLPYKYIKEKISLPKITPQELAEKLSYYGLETEVVEHGRVENFINVEINSHNCREFHLGLVENIRVKEIDAGNLVMLETGQPIHIFDYDALPERKIIVCQTQRKEEIETFQGQKLALNSEDIVVSSGEKIINLAGIIGVKGFAINSQSKNILIECADFNPKVIQKTAKRLNISTIASQFFCRKGNFLPLKQVLQRVISLIIETYQGDLSSGTIFSYQEAEKIPLQLKFSYQKKGNVYYVTIPLSRPDITIAEDLLEELLRVYDYNKVVTQRIERLLAEQKEMVKKIENICFALKDQEHNPKIKEGELTIQSLEKKKISQENFFWLETEMRVEEIKEDLFTDKGEKVVKNESNLLEVEIEPMDFYEEGLIDKLIFQGEKINQYRDLIVRNLGKEFKMSNRSFILGTPKQPINTNKWKEEDKIELSEKKKTNGRPEKSISEIGSSLAGYYQENNIKSAKLSDEDQKFLDLVFNSGEKKSEKDFSNRQEIILEGRNKVICKKRNNSGSLSFGGDFTPLENGELPEIPEASRTKINGVDIGKFFEKIGKNSISRQEIGINETGVDDNNFN